jgi:hypothetical protein
MECDWSSDVCSSDLTTGNGVQLKNADRPLITRGWDAFTSGNKTGVGRWGVYMESAELFLGSPGTDYSGGLVTIGGWLVNGTRQPNLTVNNQTRRVGIGINNPALKLSLGNDVGRKFFVYDDGGGSNDIGGGMGVDLGGFAAETSIFFGNWSGSGRLSIGAWTSSQTYSTKLTVLANGNVLIGTTIDNSHKLRVFGDANITGRVGINTVTESGIQLVINGENNSTSAFALVVRNSSFSNLFRVRNDGSVIVSSLGTGTVYSSGGILTNTNPSDSKLKENILPINYGLNEILKLNAVTFNWKNDTINQGKQYGFIAQEVQKIMPDLVKQGEYLGLDKDAIFTTLVKAIQELKEEIDTLKN